MTPTRILGISAFYHDSAACLVEDGRIADVYAQWDTLRMVQELGVVPPVGLAAKSE